MMTASKRKFAPTFRRLEPSITGELEYLRLGCCLENVERCPHGVEDAGSDRSSGTLAGIDGGLE
jgi:hypothetical protein